MKDVTHLLNAVKSFDSGSLKAASADPTKLDDPEIKGEVSKSKNEGSEEVDPPAAGSQPGTDENTIVPTGVKLEDNGGEDSPVKCAGDEALRVARDLRMKLAADFSGKTDAPGKEEIEKAEIPAKTTDLTGTEPTSEPTKVASDENMEVIPAGDLRSVIVNDLLKSASGRRLLDTALSEVTGAERASELLKKAAEAGEAEEIAALNRRFQEAEMMKQARDLQDAYGELTKDASAEDFQKIEETAEFLKLASAPFADNKTATFFFNEGLKVAAAVMQPGMEDPAAMQGAMDEAMPPAATGEPSLEELLAVLEELVAEGKIDPAQAEQLAMALASEMGGGEGAAPPEGAEGGDPTKQASAGDPIATRLSIVEDIVEGKFAIA